MLGVPFDNVTMEETVLAVRSMIESRQPHYIATANVDFVVQVQEDIELRRILFDAHMVLCDGMPLVWASKRLGNPLRERVTGADLVPRLLVEAEKLGWRVFYLGGTEVSIQAAAAKTLEKHPRLNLVGAYSPPFQALLEMDHAEILKRITHAKPDLLFVAFGCPKQEKWINMHYRSTGVAVSVGVGATLDFMAGTFRRAPLWMQKVGLEWLYRLLQEPKRLARRYGKGLWVFSRAILRQARELREQRARNAANPKSSAPPTVVSTPRGPAILEGPERLDAAEVPNVITLWLENMTERPIVLDLSRTRFIDSTGIGLLVRLRKRAREVDKPLLLAAPTPPVASALQLMKLTTFFEIEPSLEAARARCQFKSVSSAPSIAATPDPEVIQWKGEITAANLQQIAEAAEKRLDAVPAESEVTIDLREVPFVDSSGVGLMLRLKKRAWQRRVSVLYTHPTPAVSNVLKLTRLEEFLMRKPK